MLLAWAYTAVRLTEGYGLWKDRAWAEWLAALYGGVYLPLEVNHLMQHTTLINVSVLVANMVHRYWLRRKQGKRAAR